MRYAAKNGIGPPGTPRDCRAHERDARILATMERQQKLMLGDPEDRWKSTSRKSVFWTTGSQRRKLICVRKGWRWKELLRKQGGPKWRNGGCRMLPEVTSLGKRHLDPKVPKRRSVTLTSPKLASTGRPDGRQQEEPGRSGLRRGGTSRRGS